LSEARETAIPGLLEALNDSFDSVREMAIVSLARLAGDDDAIRGRIEQMASDPSPRIQKALAFARSHSEAKR
jgi:HEAT repeat protein